MRASKVLSLYTHCPVSTIHRGLGYIPPHEWRYNKDNPLRTDVVIVDECSMVDIDLFRHLLEAIDINKTKLLLIGDSSQLPSVGCGNLLHDFIESKLIPTTTLTKVFRYGEGGLMKVATDVRFMKPYLSNSMSHKATYFGSNKDYLFIDTGTSEVPRQIKSLYKKLLENNHIEDIQVLAAQKRGDCGTITLNNEIQKIANPNYGSDEFITYGDTTYYKDDLIIQMCNNYNAIMCEEKNGFYNIKTESVNDFEEGEPETAFVANGETGVVKFVCKQYMIIDFDGILIRYNKPDLKMINLGYSITIHKSQGSASKIIILATPQSHAFMCNSNLIYVGLTRMREMCYHIGSLKTVNNAVMKKANLQRMTFMQTLLKNAKQT